MTEYARDTFTRTTSSGFGSADVGGAWAETADAGWSTYVTGAVGAYQVVAVNTGRVAQRLGSAPSVAAVQAHMRWRGGGEAGATTIAQLLLRSSGTSNAQTAYAFRVGTGSGFALIADVRVLTADVLGPAIITRSSLPTVATSEWWSVEAELIGANPTRVRVRWWPTAGGPPADDSGWQEVNDSTGPQGAGIVGMRMTRGGGSGTPALIARIDEYYVADPLVPAFVASVDAVAGLTAVFDPSTSTGDPRAWSWAFGDGATSSSRNPTHTYAAAGTYQVTLTLTTRWGTKRSVTQAVVATGAPTLPPEDVRPDVFIAGENVCDRIYSVSWRNGRSRWPDDVEGSSVTLQLRGRFPDVIMGSPVTIQLPPGAPDGTAQLWQGEVDTVDEQLEPVSALTTTTIVAADVLAFLGRWHILPDTDLPEHTLPYRLPQLAPRDGITFRAKWSGVPGTRWPALKALTSSADKLRERTYLDLIRDALRANIATAWVAPEGVIMYAPFDPPAGASAYPDRVLSGEVAPIPTSYWGLGEPSGSFVDSLAGGYPGTATGTLTRAQPPLAGGNGSIAAVNLAGGVTFANIYATDTTRSVLAYVKPTAGAATYVLDKLAGAAGTYTGWRLDVTTAGELRLQVSDGAGQLRTATTAAGVLVGGVTYQVGVVMTPASWWLYVNGAVAASGAWPGAVNSTSNAVMRTLAGGVTDELGYWSQTALLPDQVRALYDPTIDLDVDGPDCPSAITVAKSTPDGIVNRWTVGDGAAVDRIDRSSIEAYGENAWSVGDGVLKTASTFPITDAIANGLRDPYPAARVTIPVRDWSARSYLAQPLDMAALGGGLYGILGVSHRVTLDGWQVELELDRDPWSLTGAGTPPVTPPVVKQRTQTFACSKDALLASPNMGAGRSTRNAIGLWGGVRFRGLFQFDLAYTDKPTRIVSAQLRAYTAGQDMCGYGGSPQVYVDRVTGSWSEGSYGNGGPPWMFSTSNAVVYPGPSCTTSGRRTQSVPSSEQTLVQLTITAIVQAWANGSANKGVRIMSTDEGSTSRTTEFHTSESPTTSRRPELVVTYEYAG